MIHFVMLALLAIPSAWAQSPKGTSNSTRTQEICSAKKKIFGSRFIPECAMFDMLDNDGKPMIPKSASYHPKRDGYLYVSPDIATINEPNAWTYHNDYPNIQGTQYYMDYAWGKQKGLPLGARLIQMMESEPGMSASVVNYLKTEWLPKQNPAKYRGQDGSFGSCQDWSAWSVKRSVHSNLKEIKHGLICPRTDEKGVTTYMPLSLGDIKEVYWSLYTPSVSANEANKIYDHPKLFRDDALYDDFKTVMDSNIGLSKLGLLGGTLEPTSDEFDPGKVFEQFQSNVMAGKGTFMDRDHGVQRWHQPVVAMVEVKYQAAQNQSAAQFLSTVDFDAGPGGEQVLAELRAEERVLVEALARGDASKGTTAISKAEALAKKRQELFNAGLIRPANGATSLKTVMKDLTVLYGLEIPFGSNRPDVMSQRSYQFASVLDQRNQPVKSVWSPETTMLSALCNDPKKSDPASHDKGFMGFSGTDFKAECDRLKAKPAYDYPVFKDSPPPRYFIAEEEEGPQSEAYRAFERLLKSCKTFDRAQEFMDGFERAILKNSLNDNEINDLAEKFQDHEFIMEPWIDEHLCHPAQSPEHLGRLISRLRDIRPSLCPPKN